MNRLLVIIYDKGGIRNFNVIKNLCITLTITVIFFVAALVILALGYYFVVSVPCNTLNINDFLTLQYTHY